ncbi:MAG: YicC family protein [Victivallales bacterium]|nr:YicC family protein [Victivallales bacterium]
MLSMTGFGKGHAFNAELGIAFDVEISSVNRKQLDIRVGLPHEISSLELLLRQLIKEKINRGAITVRVTVAVDENKGMSTVKINRPLLEHLVRECAAVQERFAAGVSWSVAELMNIPGVIESVPPDLEKDEIKASFREAVTMAVAALTEMRKREGEELRKDLLLRLDKLIALTAELEPLLQAVPAILKQKLLDKLKKEEIPVEYDDERMLKELIFYVDRNDVSEELTRLRSHFGQFRELLNKDGKAIGRNLDFLIQEIFRELTTLGNKAAGCEITPIVVKLKTELEKIREQVQNIE